VLAVLAALVVLVQAPLLQGRRVRLRLQQH
jgi:hypothetical protein